MFSGLLQSAPVGLPIRSAANKDYEWQSGSNADDLFDHFINADSFSSFEQEERRVDDFESLFEKQEAANVDFKYRVAIIDTIADMNRLDDDGVVRFVPSGECQLQAPMSSPIDGPSDFSVPSSLPRGSTVSSSNDLFNLVKQLQTQASQGASEDSPVLVSSPLEPVSVRAQRVINPSSLTDGLRPATLEIKSAPQSGTMDITAPIAVASQQQSQPLWSRRLDKSSQSSLGRHHEKTYSGYSNPSAPHSSFATPTRRPYCGFVTSNPFQATHGRVGLVTHEEIEPLSPFTTAYATFSNPASPLTSPSLSFRSPDSLAQSPFESSEFSLRIAEQATRSELRRSHQTLLTPPPSNTLHQECWTPSHSHMISPGTNPQISTIHQHNAMISPILLSSRLNQVDNWWGQSIATGTPNEVLPPKSDQCFGLGIDTTSAAARPLNVHSMERDYHALASAPRSNPLHAYPIHQNDLGYTKPSWQLSPRVAESSFGAGDEDPVKPLRPQSSRRHQRHQTVDASFSLHKLQSPGSGPRQPTARSPTPSSPLRNHRRSRSTHQTLRRKSGVVPRSRATSTAASPKVDFVNLTPYDGHRILTAVAPSGSSKTKARREKEAADRRRKLSEAAKKAVLEAGGDLGLLEKEGLLGAAE